MKNAFLTCALLALLSVPVSAEIIGVETFDYPDGALAGKTGGTFWDYKNTVPAGRSGTASTWSDLNGAPNVASGQLVTSGNGAVKRAYNGNTETTGAINDANVAKTVYYRVNVTTGPSVTAEDYFGISSMDGGTEKFYFGKSGGLPNWGVEEVGMGGTTGGPNIQPNTTYTLVVQVDLPGDTIRLYVDPNLRAEQSANTPTASLTYNGNAASTAVRFAAGTAVTWDNLVIATTWEELLTTVVTTLADEDNSTLGGGTGVSLREAVKYSPTGSLITFAPGLSGKTITLNGPQMEVPTGRSLTVDASALPNGITLDGNNSSRHFRVDSVRSLTLRGLTLTGGNGNGAGAGYNDGSGGAIYNNGGTLTLTRCTLAGNSASSNGGVIYNTGTMTLTQCTLSGNIANAGGAIFNDGTLTLTQCLLSGNATTKLLGGAIRNRSTLTLSHCTLTENTPCGIMVEQGSCALSHCTITGNTGNGLGGGLRVQPSASVSLSNCVIAGNTDRTANDISNDGTLTATGSNLIGSNATVESIFSTGPLVGTQSSPLDPKLSPLGYFGGPVQTMHPLIGSPAIDAAGTTDPSGTDARGFPRFVDGDANGTKQLDIGAVEAGPLMTVTVTADPGGGGATSLRSLITAAAGIPGARIGFLAGSFPGIITLNGTDLDIPATPGLFIDASNLSGPVTISGNSQSRVFDIPATATVAMHSLRIVGGNADNSNGGGIDNDGTCTVLSSTLSGNSAENGGGISNFGTCTVISATLSGNTSNNLGGGIHNEGTCVVISSTLSGNSGSTGGGIDNSGTCAVISSTLSGNSATGISGGGIFNHGTCDVISSTLSGNSAPRGGGIRQSVASGTTRLDFCIITNNTALTDPNVSGTTTGTNNLTSGDPLLAPLGDYGGPTQTMPPRPGSPAIDAATASTALTDQRGLPRSRDGDGDGFATPDIGAVEASLVGVSTAADTGTGSLRAALTEAAAQPGADTVYFTAAVNTHLTLASEILISDPGGVTLDATDLPTGLVIDAGPGTNRHFRIASGTTAVFQRLRLYGGGGTGGTSPTANYGGSLHNSGSLTLRECTIADCSSTAVGGAIYNADLGLLTIERCSLHGNTAPGGGAIQHESQQLLSITASTIANNTARFEAGAINAPFTRPVSITHCTITGNAVTQVGANGIGGVRGEPAGFVTVRDSIISGNTDANLPGTPNINAGFISQGNNVTSDNAKLAPLGDYGGPTWTMPPMLGSPAIDTAASSTATTDQRNAARPQDGDADTISIRDIGAVEAPTPLVVNTAADENDAPAGAQLSLREAIRDADAGATILFASSFNSEPADTITLSQSLGEIAFTKGLIIDGSGSPGGVTIDGGSGNNRIFNLPPGTGAFLRRLTLTGGNGSGGPGGAINNDQATLALVDCTLTGNTADAGAGAAAGRGGGIHNYKGLLTLDRCLLKDNYASVGGGAISTFAFSLDRPATSSTSLTNCTVTDNSAYFYGCIYNENGRATLLHCTITDNFTYNDQFSVVHTWRDSRTHTYVQNCLIAGNYNSSDVGSNGVDNTPELSVTSLGGNLIGSGNATGAFNQPGDATAHTAASLRLAPLGNYGGPTHTMALRPGSPAISNATPSSVTTDQRGLPAVGAKDSGAYELGSISPSEPYLVLNNATTGSGSLPQAIANAQSHPGLDVITILPEADGGVLNLINGLVASDPDGMTIDANALLAGFVINGNGSGTTLFTFTGAGTFTLRGLTLTNGNASANGGAIVSNAVLRLENCAFTTNSANADGGAIASSASLALTNCTFSGNTALRGGAIYSSGPLSLTHCTLAGNSAQNGGALYAESTPWSMTHSIVASNSLTAVGNGRDIFNAGSLMRRGANIVQVHFNGTNGTDSGPAAINADPMLAGLNNYGSSTASMPPLLGSPAIDQASVLNPELTRDQRGLPRRLGLRPDIGAVEASIVIVTTPVDEVSSPNLGNGISLREAIDEVPVGGTVVFDRAVFHSTTTNTITLTKGPLNPVQDCTLDGSLNPGGIKIVHTPTITAQPLSQSVSSGAPANFAITVATIYGGVSYVWRKNGTPNGTTTPAFNIASAQESDEAVYDVMLGEAASPGVLTLVNATISPFAATSQPASLIVGGAPVTIQRSPSSAMLTLGSSHTLSVVAVGPPTPALTYQWFKAGKAISGATKSSYLIPKAALTHAGAYTCVVKSGTTSVTSTTAEIGVVDTTPKTLHLAIGGTFAPLVNAAGNGLQPFVWKRDATVLAPTAKTFTIKPVAVGDAGLYTCTVTGLAGEITTGCNTRLTVSNAAPQIVKPLDLPVATIGHAYFYQIPIANVAGAPATAFTVTGLPPGMTWDKLTGIISGRPTTSTKPLGYPLTIKASNPKSSDTATAMLKVNVVPPTAVGVFAGPLERSPLNDNLGGRFDLTTTATGLCSGSVTLGARAKLSFTNQLLLSAGVGDAILRVNIPGLTMADKTPLTAYLEVFAAEQIARLTLLHPNGSTLLATAWRNTWSKTKPATAYAATYTARLDPADSGTAPRGYGFATLIVKPDGTLTLTGKLPDGSGLTQAGFVGPEGQLTFFNLLYTKRGSLVGPMQLTPGTPVANNTLGGTLDWFKPGPLPKSTDLVYQAGFGPLAVTVEGSPYIAPAKGQRVMDLGTAPNPNAKLDFTLGGLAPEFAQLLHITNPSATGLTNKGTLTLPLTNTTKLTTLDAAKGLFTGSFVISGAATALNRPSPFEGLIVRIGTTTQGYGYFLLPTATPKISTSPKLSGRVVLGTP